MDSKPGLRSFPYSGYFGRGCYHPHVHCLVTGGGISDDGRDWHPARKAFLVPHMALAKLLRGKLKACSPTNAQTWLSPLPPGPSPGSSTSTIGGKVTRPCCAISHDTSSASPSPTRASSLSTTTPSPSATSSASQRAGAGAACPATSSCAGSSNTSCPKACTRSAISAFGTRPSVNALRRPVFSSNSNAQHSRPPNPRHQAPAKALIKPSQPPPNRGAVHVAAKVISSTSAGTHPKRLSDHDPLLPFPGPIVRTARVLDAPRLASLQRPDHLDRRVQ